MADDPKKLGRRAFLKGGAAAALGAAIPLSKAKAEQKAQANLSVWSCGGLAEAFMPANQNYEEKYGPHIFYTGAFAAALGKSLLGSATTEVFGGRVLALAQKLRKAGKMDYFKPLCYTSYVLVTPKGNPAGIESIQDLARPGVRLLMAPEASPPGGAAAMGILKKAGVIEAAKANLVNPGTCVQRTMEQLIEGQGDVSVVEMRLTRMPQFSDKAEIIPIPEKFFPPPPLTFTVGRMKDAKDKKLADHFIDYITSPEGQAYFEKAGFIPANSDKGRELTEKLGVKDV